jgi:hypothetical protein
MDGSDHDRFFSEISRATYENVQEARSLERLIADTLAPLPRQAFQMVKEMCGSAHRRRWRNLSD